MTTIPHMFDQAVKFHQAGNFQQAEQYYRWILEADPRHADALHLLGVLCHQTGRNDPAVAYIREAIRLRPDFPEAHTNLGSVLRRQGKLDEAVASCAQRLQLNPDCAEAYNNLGNALREQKKPDEAIAVLKQCLHLRPQYAETHHNLGVVYREQGKLDDALECCREALRLRPNYAEAHNSLGNVFKDQSNLKDAVRSYRQALFLKPSLVEVHNSLGLVLQQQGKLDDALACYREALRHKPDYPEAYINLGNVLCEQEKLDEAVAAYEQSIRLNPKNAGAFNNLGAALHKQGKYDEELAKYQAALKLDPNDVGTHVNFALNLLLHGHLERGWPEYEWRLQDQKDSRNFSQPLWDGSDLTGKTILFHAEQGIGDIVQFVRYAPLIQKRGGTVILECPVRLTRLLGRLAGVDRVVPEGSTLPDFNVHLPLLSAPGIFGTTLATIPADIPYVFAESNLIDRWAHTLEEGEKGRRGEGESTVSPLLPFPPSPFLPFFRIGISWQGNPEHGGDRYRSLPLTCFEPLAGVQGVRLVSLQKGRGTEHLSQLAGRFPVVDLDSRLDLAGEAFVDSVAVMMNLDLVVTVDSALAHVAGALGVPVWVALSSVPDWRWLLNREDSPWYPTMRLFRQKTLGDWKGVFERMAQALQVLVADRNRR